VARLPLHLLHRHLLHRLLVAVVALGVGVLVAVAAVAVLIETPNTKLNWRRRLVGKEAEAAAVKDSRRQEEGQTGTLKR
jgi:hypothetical protein